MLTIQYFLNGLMTGSMNGLVGIAIVIIFKSTKVFNFAVGSLLTFGGLVCLTLMTHFHLSLWIALFLALVVSGILGILVERLAMRPLLAQPLISMIMATLLLDSIVNGSIIILWTTYTYAFPLSALPGATIKIGSIFISHEAFYTFIIALIGFVFIGLFFGKTHIGLKMRTTAESHTIAMSLGINVVNIFTLSWILACLVGTLAGVLIGNRVGLQVSITPGITFRAITGVMLGGLDSIPGAVIGGMIVGILEQMGGGILGSKYGELVPYIILLLVLFIRPEGLFGIKRIERI